MKSKLFNKNLWLENDRFKEDLKRLVEFPVESIVEAPNVVVDVHLANTSAEADEVFSIATKKMSVDEAKLRSTFQVIGNFVREMAPDGDAAADSIDSIVADIKDAEIIPSSSIEKLREFLIATKKTAAERFHRAEKKKQYQDTGLPTLIGVSTTVNLRAVFEKEFKSNMSVETYDPRCEGLIPTATVKLRFDSDSPFENVFFQASQREIRILKEHLESLEKQLSSTIDFVKDGVL